MDESFKPTIKYQPGKNLIKQGKVTTNQPINNGGVVTLVDDTARLVDDPQSLVGGQKVASDTIFIK